MLSSVVPRQQEAKLLVLKQIVDALPDSVISKLKPAEARRLREVRDQIAVQRPIAVAQAPQSLVDRFRERDGSVGRLAVVTAKPLARLEEGPNLQAFVEAVREVPVGGEKYEATGENVVLADLLKNIEALSAAVPTAGGGMGGSMIMPAIRARDFSCTSQSDAV